MFREVNSDVDKQHLQNDLDKLVKWSEKWQMLFICMPTHRTWELGYKMIDLF